MGSSSKDEFWQGRFSSVKFPSSFQMNEKSILRQPLPETKAVRYSRENKRMRIAHGFRE